MPKCGIFFQVTDDKITCDLNEAVKERYVFLLSKLNIFEINGDFSLEVCVDFS